MKQINELKEFFSDEKNKQIKKDILAEIHSMTQGSNQMSCEKLDKVRKMISYQLQLFDLSEQMGKQLKKV